MCLGTSDTNQRVSDRDTNYITFSFSKQLKYIFVYCPRDQKKAALGFVATPL